MERQSIAPYELEIVNSLGGDEGYAQKDYEQSGDHHYSDVPAHLNRGIRNKELVKRATQIVGIGLIAFGLLGCNGAMALDEDTVIWGDERAKTPANITHEKEHQGQMKTVGGADVFWRRYLTEDGFDCKAEISAGADPETHFACYDDDYQSWTWEEIHAPFQSDNGN